MGHTLPMTYKVVVIRSNIEVTQGKKVELGENKRKSETDENLGSHGL